MKKIASLVSYLLFSGVAFSQIPSELYFDGNSSKLNNSAKATIDDIIAKGKANGCIIFCYSADFNPQNSQDTLNEARANNTKKYMSERGISNIIVRVGKGAITESGNSNKKAGKIEIVTDPSLIKKYTVAPLSKCPLFDMQKIWDNGRINTINDESAVALSGEVVVNYYANGDKYVGKLSPNGMKLNLGTYIFANGEKYIGDYQNDKKEGKGKYTWANGDSYEGEWKNDTPINGALVVVIKRKLKEDFKPVSQCGIPRQALNALCMLEYQKSIDEMERDTAFCIATYQDDTFMVSGEERIQLFMYTGKFRNLQRTGPGIFKYGFVGHIDDHIYIGEYKLDKKEGRGVETILEGYSNGKPIFSKYDGEWKRDMKTGIGQYYINNKELYSGEWRNDKRHGTGKETYYKYTLKRGGEVEPDYTSQGVYEGEWENDGWGARGKFYWPNGQTYSGDFLTPHTKGISHLNYILSFPSKEWLMDNSRAKFQSTAELASNHAEWAAKFAINKSNDSFFVINWKEWKENYSVMHYKALGVVEYIGDNHLEGNGTIDWPNGNKYVGTFKNSKREGTGTMTWLKNTWFKYEGEWKNDYCDGHGKLSWTDGSIYDGEWREGVRNGNGTMRWINGEKYSGEWLDGDKHGKGKFMDSRGGVYDGSFFKDKEHGQGKYKWKNGDVFVGYFENGYWIKGKMTYSNGSIYEGGFIPDPKQSRDCFNCIYSSKNGYGVMTYADGSRYEGQWKKDKKDGRGTEYSREGRVTRDGEWENDKRK